MKEKEKEEIEFVYSPNFLILAHRQETVQQVFPSGMHSCFTGDGDPLVEPTHLFLSAPPPFSCTEQSVDLH